MNTTKTLEKKNYNIDRKTLGALAREAFKAQGVAKAMPGIYFRVLIANTQAALIGAPRVRATKGEKLTEDQIALHVQTLQAEAEPMYEEILAAANDVYPGRGNGELRHKETTFARTAKSTLRKWIEAGKDITSVVAARSKKTAFRIEREAAEVNPDTVMKRAEVAADRIVEQIKTITEPEKRRAALEAAMSKLEQELAPLMGGATKDPKEAMRDHIPLKIPGAGTFRPAIVNGFRLAS
jgi:hypothetical protein